MLRTIVSQPNAARQAWRISLRILGLRCLGLGFRVSSFGFRVSGLGFRVEGLGFRVGYRFTDYRAIEVVFTELRR